MTRSRPAAALCLVPLLLGIPAAAAETGPLKDLDALVERGLADWKVPGLALAVVKDGRVVLLRGYGVRDVVTREKVTPETLFSIASATKPFTATLAAMAVAEKRIEWDTPLGTYFPGFGMHDPAAAAKVTLRDLLTHRSGIPRQKFFSLNPPATRAEVRGRLRFFEPTADFRSAFQYCNETVTVAGDMVAERMGSTWEELVASRLLKPLGMDRTLFSVRDLEKDPDHALPYIDWGEGPEPMEFHDASILGPAGGIVSSASDLARFVQLNLARGQKDGKPLVDAAQLGRIQSPQVPVPRATREKEVLLQAYGIGWFLDAWRGYLHVHHGGVLYGFSSHVSFLPTENVGLVVLANLNGTPLTTIVEGWVYDRLLGLAPSDWDGRAKAQEAKVREAWEKAKRAEEMDPCGRPETRPGRPLPAYAGTYRSEGYGTLTVREEGGELATTLWTDRCPLRACGGDRFDLYHPVERQGWRATFQGPPGAAAASLAVKLGPGLKEVVYTRVAP
jgi:CubicO group peptidase (beta-lactamase class C family)